MTTRNEQKEQRRTLIISKALELFVKKGYTDTTIGDIAKAADMSTGLMFHYFKSKEQLYEEIVRMGVNATNSPQKLPAENPLAYFEEFINALFKFSKEQPWVFYMFVLVEQAARSDSIPSHIKELAASVNQIEQSAEIIKRGQQQGCIREGNPFALSFTFWSCVQGIMEQLAAAPERLEDDLLLNTDWIIDILRGAK